MSETDTEISKLAAASDKQVEADEKFEKITQTIVASLSPAAPAPPSSPASPSPSPSSDPAFIPRLHRFEPVTFDPPEPREDDKRLETKVDSADPPPPPRPALAASPSLLPQVFEDRYAKGWRDACEFVQPQQHELQRRYLLAKRTNASLDRWMKWLPAVCFCCTLFGFALGWCVANLTANRSLNPPHKVEIVPKM